MKNATVSIVVNLDRGIDTTGRSEFNGVARSIKISSGLCCGDFDVLARFDLIIDVNIENFRSRKVEGFGGLASLITQWQNAHADEIAAMDSLKGFSNDGLDAEQKRTFGSPVA